MRNIRFCLFFLLGLVVMPMALNAQMKQVVPVELQWNGVEKSQFGNDTIFYIALENGYYNGIMPTFNQSLPIYDDAVKVAVELKDVKTAPLTAEEWEIAKGFSYHSDFELEAIPLRSRDEALLSIRIVPFCQNGNGYEKLVSANLMLTLTPDFSKVQSSPTYASTSAMSWGNWYKIGLPESGIYKLTYDDLVDLGINVANVDPRQIRIYHNGGGVLPELNAESRYDDLVEIPIYVAGESDGSFDRNDYILFYGRGPVTWSFNSERVVFEHNQNPFEDYSYAFVVTGQGNGKRIAESVPITASVNETVSQFIDYQVHEVDKFNLNKTGRTYYGDKLEGNASLNLSFDFPNAVTSRYAQIHSELAGRNFKPASFTLLVDGVTKDTYPVPTVSSSAQE